jgi:hypothetical protein
MTLCGCFPLIGKLCPGIVYKHIRTVVFLLNLIGKTPDFGKRQKKSAVRYSMLLLPVSAFISSYTAFVFLGITTM